MRVISFLSLFLFFSTTLTAQPDLRINEIMASNHSVLADQVWECEDWVEIYNAGSTDINLAGYYVTDNLNNSEEFQQDSTASNLILPSGGYLLIWASGEPDRGENHTSFV